MSILEKLPYVDGNPAEGQDRIRWITNGDLLNGSDTKYGHDGNLNEAGVQIQQNVVALAELIGDNSTDLTEINLELVKINEKLGELADQGVTETLNLHGEEINSLKTSVSEINDGTTVQNDRIDSLELSIGPKIPASGTDTINADIYRLKTVVGNEYGQDINGLPLPDNDRTGLIRKIHDTTTQVVTNTAGIATINATLTNSNPTQTKADVAEIRDELGSNPNGNSVYDRLEALETFENSTETKISDIETSIGSHDVATELTAHETSISSLTNELNTPTTGVKARVAKVESDISTPGTGITARLTETSNDVLELQVIVGETDETGLRKSIIDINTTIGSDISPEDISIRGQLATLSAGQLSNASQIQDVNVILGTSTTGLQGDSIKYSKSLYGDSGASDPVDISGVVVTTKSLYNSLIATNEKLVELSGVNNYVTKTFSTISDVLMAGIQTQISTKLRSSNSVIPATVGSAGVASINLSANLAASAAAEVVLINVGTYDYVENTPLGTLDDAKADGTTGTFYFELFKLLDTVVTSSSANRVFISNGFKSTEYGSIAYPAVNTASHAYSDYIKAIVEIAEIYSVPVLDTAGESGINIKNNALFSTSAGLTDTGRTRLANYIAASINSK